MRRKCTEVAPAFGASSPSFLFMPSVCTTLPTPACVMFLTLRSTHESGERWGGTRGAGAEGGEMLGCFRVLLGQLFADLEAAEDASRRCRIVAPHHHVPCIQGRFTLKPTATNISDHALTGDTPSRREWNPKQTFCTDSRHEKYPRCDVSAVFLPDSQNVLHAGRSKFEIIGCVGCHVQGTHRGFAHDDLQGTPLPRNSSLPLQLVHAHVQCCIFFAPCTGNRLTLAPSLPDVCKESTRGTPPPPLPACPNCIGVHSQGTHSCKAFSLPFLGRGLRSEADNASSTMPRNVPRYDPPDSSPPLSVAPLPRAPEAPLLPWCSEF